MRISDWSSDVCSSDLRSDAWLGADWDFVDGELFNHKARTAKKNSVVLPDAPMDRELTEEQAATFQDAIERLRRGFDQGGRYLAPQDAATAQVKRSEEHTSELQSLMRISYAVFCL